MPWPPWRLGEISASKLVETPGSETFAQVIFDRMHYGVTNDVAALCLVLLGAVILLGAFGAGLPHALVIVAQRQVNRLPGLRAPGHRLGELHVGKAGGKVGELNRLAAADGLHEVRLDGPVAGQLRGDRDLGQGFARSRLLAAPPAGATDAVGQQVVMEDAFAPVKINSHGLSAGSHAAEMVAGPGPVVQHGQDLHAVRRAHRPAHAALRIDPRRQEGVDLGQHAHRRRRPAQERLMDNAQGEHVVTGQGRILPPRKRRRRVGQGGVETVNPHLAKVAQEAFLN